MISAIIRPPPLLPLARVSAANFLMPLSNQITSPLSACLCVFMLVCAHVCFLVYLKLHGLSVTTPFPLLPLQFLCVYLFAQLVLCSPRRQRQPNPTAVLPDSEPMHNEGPTLRSENKLQLSMNAASHPPPPCQSIGYTETLIQSSTAP